MLTIYRSEGSASLRRVPMWLVTSDGTSPATGESGGQPQICWHARGTTTVNTSGTLSLVSANAGLYHAELTASEVSALGIFSLHYRSATAVANAVFGKVVNYDSGDSTRQGLFALPNAAADASGGLIVMGTGTNQLQPSQGSVGLRAIVHSQATVGGTDNITPRNYSGVSIEVKSGGIQSLSVGAGNYSGMSVEIKTKGIATNSIETANVYSSLTIQGISNYANISNVTLAAGTHSNVTIQGVTLLNSSVTLNANTHSGATIQGVTRVNSSVTVADALYSAVTVRLDIAQSFSGVTIDGVRIVSTAGERSIASSLLSTSIGGTTPRLVQQTFELLRNRVQVSGSTMTVYKADDTTSSWTATISTGTATVYGVAPGIA